VARSFTAGLVPVAVVAAVVIAVARPAPGPPVARTAFASEVPPVAARNGPPPPSREDLIDAICTGYLATVACERELMELYRACGVDGAHPRTTDCAAAVRHARRSAAK
jgi:hypothetical protein